MDINALLNDERWSLAFYTNEKAKYIKEFEGNITYLSEEINAEKWKNLFLNNEDLLTYKLKTDNLTLKEFEEVTRYSIFPCDYKNVPWHNELVKIFKNNKEISIDDFMDVNKDEVPFFNFLIPFLTRHIQVLKEKLVDLNKDIEIKKISKITTKILSNAIIDLSIRTLIYELNRARVENELKGETSEERYDYFLNFKVKNYEDILKLLIEYPVLGRILAELMIKFNENSIKIIEKFTNDKEEIKEKFGMKLNGLKAVKSLGDLHNGAESVLSIEFSNDEKVLYKPKNLTIDENFQKLLEWFNKNGISKKFKTIGIINKGAYGWQQYIEHKECVNEEEVKSFFQRQGEYLAIMHMVNAVDMHCENIIAYGEYPIFVDLESLFHGDVILSRNYIRKDSAIEKATSILAESVIRTYLLPVNTPNSLWKDDVSGIASDVEINYTINEIKNKNTDMMNVKKKQRKGKKNANLPTLNGSKIEPKNYISCLEEGFSECYKIINNNKDILIKKVEELFKDNIIRIILRATRTYESLLVASKHPKYLQSGVDRNLLFDYMWSALRFDDAWGKVVPYECYDLLNGDVPYFYSKVGYKDIMHNKDNAIIKDIAKKESLLNVIEKIESMGIEDYNIQKDIINNILKTRYLIESQEDFLKIHKKDVGKKKILKDVSARANDKEIFLKEAIKIGDIIKDMAIIGEDNNSVCWISLAMSDKKKTYYKVSDIGLYSGISGVGLFYAYLWEKTGNLEYMKMVDMCINTSYDMIESKFVSNVSIFTGYASLLYLLTHCAILFNRNDFIDKGKEIIDKIDELIFDDNIIDIISGCSGTAIACIEFYKLFKYDKALDVAKKCGNHIIKKSIKLDRGVGWSVNPKEEVPLAGIAHGNAGICLSLIALYDITKDDKYLSTFKEGMYYEKSLYNAEENNWMDCRNLDGTNEIKYSKLWCNGAPGIGMSRIAMAKYYISDELYKDIKNAIDKTLEEGFTLNNDCICHGYMGNLDLILLGQAYLNDKNLNKKAYNLAYAALENINGNCDLFKVGVMGKTKDESLMTGLAGVGYELLRLYDNNIPSVLILEGPKVHN